MNKSSQFTLTISTKGHQLIIGWNWLCRDLTYLNLLTGSLNLQLCPYSKHLFLQISQIIGHSTYVYIWNESKISVITNVSTWLGTIYKSQVTGQFWNPTYVCSLIFCYNLVLNRWSLFDWALKQSSIIGERYGFMTITRKRTKIAKIQQTTSLNFNYA